MSSDVGRVIEAVLEEMGVNDDRVMELINELIGIRLPSGCCVEDAFLLILVKLKVILCLLKNEEFGLEEIKREIQDIEDKLDSGQTPRAGAITTGPFFVRTGSNNAIAVRVQNTGADPIDVDVRLFNIGACPPALQDSASLTDIGGVCCAKSAVLQAPAGSFEAVFCPDPATASIRAFVSLHNGAAANAQFEYVIKAGEMLPSACSLCEPPVVNGQ